MTALEATAETTAAKPVHTRALIIGSGFSGLGMGIALQQQNIDFLILEKADDIGGNWNYGSPSSRVFHRTHLVSSKRLTQYPDSPMPADYPDFPSHWQAQRYLQAYDARERQAREGLPRLESQREALKAAGLGLDAAQAGTQAALKEALQRDPRVRQALEEPPGPGRVVELMAGLERERERQVQVELTAEVARQEQLRREQVRQLELQRARGLGLGR